MFERKRRVSGLNLQIAASAMNNYATEKQLADVEVKKRAKWAREVTNKICQSRRISIMQKCAKLAAK